MGWLGRGRVLERATDSIQAIISKTHGVLNVSDEIWYEVPKIKRNHWSRFLVINT